MTKTGVKRLAIGAVVLGAVVVGTAVVMKRRKARVLRKKKKALKLESRLLKVGVYRAASRAQIAATRDEVLA